MGETRRNGNGIREGASLLMYACQQGHEAEVRHILSTKPSAVRDRDRTKKTALHYCAENTNLNCIDQILSADRSLIDLADDEGYTALHLAVISGNRGVTRYLVNKGADLGCLDNEKHSLVHWATVCGEIECMAILIEAGSDASTADIHGAYPIHYAAQMCGPNNELGNNVRTGLAALRRLLAYGVNVNVTDQDNRPPLLWAASAGSSDAMLALINAGANVNCKDKDGLTALHCAASRGHNECFETLYNLCGAELDAVDHNGCTPLFYAVTLGHADCTELLLKYGAEANRQDRKGRTPAHCGAAKGQLETLKILSKHGANLWLKNIRGDLPLHEAVHSGRKVSEIVDTFAILDLVKWLLEQRPDAVNVGNNDGRTPLHIAAINNNVELCKVLLDNNANLNAIMKNSRGKFMTPLDAALSRGRGSCAKYLQLSGALTAAKIAERSRANNDGRETNGTSPDHDSLTLTDKVTNYLERSDPANVGSPQDDKASQVDFFKHPLKDQGSQTLPGGGGGGVRVHHHTHPNQHLVNGTHLHHGPNTAKTAYLSKQQERNRSVPNKHSHSQPPPENVSPVSGGTLTTQKDSGISDTHGLSERGDYSDLESDNASIHEVGSENGTLPRRRRFRTARAGGKRGASDSDYEKKLRNQLNGRISEDAATGKAVMSANRANDITNTVQMNMKKYQRERRIFQALLELKRLQIRNGRINEQSIVKKLADNYSLEGLTVNHQKFTGPYTYRAFDNYLYDQLRLLSNTGSARLHKTKSEGNGVDGEGDDDPSKCTQRTYQCHHAAHAYTGIPCAAFIRAKNRDSFLPQIFPVGKDGHAFNVKDLDPKDTVTLEVKQGKEKKAFTLPTESLDKNKRYQVTFTISLTTPFSAKGTEKLKLMPAVGKETQES